MHSVVFLLCHIVIKDSVQLIRIPAQRNLIPVQVTVYQTDSRIHHGNTKIALYCVLIRIIAVHPRNIHQQFSQIRRVFRQSAQITRMKIQTLSIGRKGKLIIHAFLLYGHAGSVHQYGIEFFIIDNIIRIFLFFFINGIKLLWNQPLCHKLAALPSEQITDPISNPRLRHSLIPHRNIGKIDHFVLIISAVRLKQLPRMRLRRQ